MSVSHGHNTIAGIEYGGCGEDKKREIVSHQLGVSTGYGDAISRYQCECRACHVTDALEL